MPFRCTVCGGEDFCHSDVLWDELTKEWEINEEEVAYINAQQGTYCIRCRSNLRTIALSDAIRFALGTTMTLREVVHVGARDKLRILDINGAFGISDAFTEHPGYERVDYPQVDMQEMPFNSKAFDLIFHSDTLEHIEDPVRALAECRRVLTANGALCFTIPIIVGRMSRSRFGMPPSYHGAPSVSAYDFRVQTEFGADAWVYVFRAGFTNVQINTVAFPAAQAITARNLFEPGLGAIETHQFVPAGLPRGPAGPD